MDKAANLVNRLREQCNKHVNGTCHTRKCLVKGGWKPGRGVDYAVATCQAAEDADLVEALQARVIELETTSSEE